MFQARSELLTWQTQHKKSSPGTTAWSQSTTKLPMMKSRTIWNQYKCWEAKKKQKAVQSNEMMAECILASLTKAINDKLFGANHRVISDCKDPVNCSSHVPVKESHGVDNVRNMIYKQGIQGHLRCLIRDCVQVKGDLDTALSNFMKSHWHQDFMRVPYSDFVSKIILNVSYKR